MNMQNYILSVSGAVLIAAIATILLPESKIGKFINGIMKVFCLLIIFLPLPGLAKTIFGKEAPSFAVSGELEPDDAFLDYMFSARAREQEESVEAVLEEQFGLVVKTQIVWECVEYAYTVKQVSVKIENFGIYGEEEHIFVIEQVKSRVMEMFSEAEVQVIEWSDGEDT